MSRKKKSVRTRVLSFLKKGSLNFSLGSNPITYSLPLSKLRRKEKVRKAKAPLVKAEIIPPQTSFPLTVRSSQTNINPIQREALPMIAQKIDEARSMGRNDLVLWWSMIEYAVRSPRKARRTLEEVLGAFG